MNIPFAKAHGALNDFLLTWDEDAARVADLPAAARALCDRRAGIGADGWLLVTPEEPADTGRHGAIRLFNPDGGEVELSGNGTRCAAALLIESGYATTEVKLLTGAGEKHLRVTERHGLQFSFEMNMGRPEISPDRLRAQLPLATGERDVTIVNVGNPQCVVFVDDFSLDWRSLGAEIERHSWFPQRTNVSFVRPLDEHTLDVRFFERGAGETMSSGTGSTGAAVAAIARGLVMSPVAVQTPAGLLQLRWEDDLYLTGPAVITGRGDFYNQ